MDYKEYDIEELRILALERKEKERIFKHYTLWQINHLTKRQLMSMLKTDDLYIIYYKGGMELWD